MNKIYLTPKCRVIVVLFLLSLGLVCINNSCNRITKSNIKSCELFYKWEFYNDSEMNIVTMLDSIQIMERNGIIMYRIAKPYENTRVELDSTGAIKSERLLSNGIRYIYFFYKEGMKTGLVYDSLNSASYKVVNAPTFLKSKISFNSKMFYNANDSLLSVSESESQVIEIYFPKTKSDDSIPDSSILLYSDHLPLGLTYSLSPGLDSLKKMKLTKASFIHNKRPKVKSDGYEIPRREYIFEIRENKEKIPKEMTRFFDNADKIIMNVEQELIQGK